MTNKLKALIRKWALSDARKRANVAQPLPTAKMAVAKPLKNRVV